MKKISIAIVSIVALALTACGGSIDVKKLVETDIQKALQSKGMQCGVEKDTNSVQISCEDSLAIIAVKATVVNKVKPVEADSAAVKDSAVVKVDSTKVDSAKVDPVEAKVEEVAKDTVVAAPVAAEPAVADTTAPAAEAPVAAEPEKAIVDSAAVSNAIDQADSTKQEPVKVDTAATAPEAPKA